MKFATPVFTGIAGASQLFTACTLWRKTPGIDIGVTGTLSWDLLWSVPVGAVLGATLGYIFLWFPGRAEVWREWRSGFLSALVLSSVFAPMSPGFLGLGPQTLTQLRLGFTVIYGIVWFCLLVIARLERAAQINK